MEQSLEQNKEEGSNSNRTNAVSFRPRAFTSQTDRVAISRASGSLEEVLDGAESLKDERFVSISTRQMPLDVWNIMKGIYWKYGRGNVNVKRAAIHAVIVEKGTLILRGLSEYRELGSLGTSSAFANLKLHREFSLNRLDYRFDVRDFRTYRASVTIRCQTGTRELIEELAESYHTNISLITGMAVIVAFTTAVNEDTVPRELATLCGNEFESFQREVGELLTLIRD